jgi:hypothetical protein
MAPTNGADQITEGPKRSELLRRSRSSSKALHELRLAVRSLVLVDDTLGGSLVETLDCESEGFGSIFGTGGLQGSLDASFELTADGFVALLCLGVGEDALLLALDIGHGLFGALSSCHPTVING